MSGARRQTAADRAHAHIRAAIMNGEFAPGAMLSENELAGTLAMSRTPVRAALARLQDEGWVRIYAQRGALVRELTPTEIRESAETRHALESAGVQRTPADRREDLAARLSASVDDQERALARGDFGAFVQLAMRFHRSFVEAAQNATMLAIYDRLQDRQYLSIVHSADRITQDPSPVLREHRALIEHARQGDWVAFAAHLYRHQSRSHGIEDGLPAATSTALWSDAYEPGPGPADDGSPS